MPDDDPYRMFLVLRRGAITTLERGGELAGAAAVACVRDPRFAGAVEAWRARPGKVCLRARNPTQWEQVLDAHAADDGVLAGDPEGEAVLALAPRRRSERGPLLERLQAMSGALEPPPTWDPAEPAAKGHRPDAGATLAYVLNPRLEMSSGKTLAQIGHAAVLAADTGTLEDWVTGGCPARVALASDPTAFEALCARDDLAAKVVDAGLTEVPPGTVTVLALPVGSLPTPR